MCEWKVVVKRGDKEEEIMEVASLVRAEGGAVIVEGTFGERKEVEGSIAEIDSDRHLIIISSDERTQA
jgi:predicted RNA-binding protein